jgi:hypothetical protein
VSAVVSLFVFLRLRLFYGFTAAVVPLIFCVTRLLAIRTVAVLLMLGIPYKEASAVMAAYHDTFRAFILFAEVFRCGIFRHHPCQHIPCYIEHGIHIGGEHEPVVLRINYVTDHYDLYLTTEYIPDDNCNTHRYYRLHANTPHSIEIFKPERINGYKVQKMRIVWNCIGEFMPTQTKKDKKSA